MYVEYLPQSGCSLASNGDIAEMWPELNAAEPYVLSFLLIIESPQVLLMGMGS